MTDITTVVENYFSIWNEPDPALRDRLVTITFTDDATHLGPWLAGEGHDGIAALATQLREHLGDHRFQRTGNIDAHHDRVRFSWEIVPAPGAPLFAAGTDFGKLDEDGRLQSITTFLDVVPEGAEEH
jgi:hypothetical protein